MGKSCPSYPQGLLPGAGSPAHPLEPWKRAAYVPTCSSQGSSLPLLPRCEGLASLKEKQVSLAVGAKGRQVGDTRPRKQLWGPLSSGGFRCSPPCIGQKVPHGFLELEDSGHPSSTSGSGGQGRVAPQFSRPNQGSEHLPQAFIQGWLATWLLFFSVSLPSEARAAL